MLSQMRSLLYIHTYIYIYIYIYIDGLPPLFAHKVKQELIGKNDTIDYDNLTYGDIFNTIKKFGINMYNDQKILKRQLKK